MLIKVLCGLWQCHLFRFMIVIPVFFVTQTRSVATQALHYLTGLVQAFRKNVERMTEVIIDSEHQSLQHFVSHSPWDYRAQ